MVNRWRTACSPVVTPPFTLRTIRVWDTSAGASVPPVPLQVLSGHTGYVSALSLSPDGMTLYSAGVSGIPGVRYKGSLDGRGDLGWGGRDYRSLTWVVAVSDPVTQGSCHHTLYLAIPRPHTPAAFYLDAFLIDPPLSQPHLPPSRMPTTSTR